VKKKKKKKKNLLATMAQVLQFQALNSAVEAAFWHELGEMKIEHFKLDDKARPIQAYYSTGTTEEIPPRICLGSNALSNPKSVSPVHPSAQ
jgi:hypothetical protein